jgi:hypothetical protein
MERKTIYAIVAVLIIIIVVGAAAAYYLMNTGGGGGITPTPTPTTSPANNVANATTLTFSANVTSQGSTITYNWAGKNFHTTPTIRVDFAGYSYLLNAGQEKSWSSTNNGSTWTSGNFTADWPAWGAQWQSYVDALTPGHWSGSGDYTFTDTTGATVTLFNISVNPTIPDSTFTAS